MSLRCDLLIIDPQVDFCDPKGALFVPGADADTKRLTTMVKRIAPKLNDIHVTLDTHHWFHIAHPSFWVDSKGQSPAPFTLITYDDVKNGTWKPAIPAYYSRETMKKAGQDRDGVLEYTKSLHDNQRYVLVIWPPHCLIGSPGHAVMPELYSALLDWEKANKTAYVDYVTKGSNLWTEHYSAVQADVPDPSDPTTGLNVPLIETLQKVDLIGISGQALSHCVANTITDIANNFGEENIKKFVLLEDTTSSVGGFEKLGTDFVKALTARGMQTARSTDFLA